MSVIKRRTRGKHVVRHITRFDRDNNETLFAFAAFLDEPTEYVLNQLIEIVLAKDKDFQQWREAHPESCVPRQAGKRPPRSRPSSWRPSSAQISARDAVSVGANA